MINTAKDLWKEIKAKRNFDEKYYDIKEAEYIKNELGLPLDNTILVGLNKSNVSVEELIKVFFEANQSYTTMMNDLLSMFEEIGAKQTDHQLEISFEFDKDMPYTIDLNSFKSQIEKWKTIEKEILIPTHPTIDDYWSFSNDLRVLNFPGNIDYEIINYKNFHIDFNQTKYSVLNILLDKYKDFLIEIVEEIKKYGTEKQTLGERRFKSAYANLGLDNWPWLVSNQLQQLAQNFDGLIKEQQERYLNTLRDFLELNGFKKQTIQERVKILEDYLDLPFWKKRYELYSVWIFKLIYDVIKTHNHKIHVVDGKLTFPFKETHLATFYPNSGRNVFIYCEKKTALNNPIGKGRSKNIQPDYSFFTEPLSDVNSSILEIECKQYKRPSNDNFARAVVDYTNGRPQSQVFLVNHGDMNSVNINKKAKALDNSFDPNRCHYFASLNSTLNQQEKLKNAIKEIIFEGKLLTKKSIIKARLTWGSEPNDLDLLVEYTHLNNKTIVNYQNDEAEGITFGKDIQKGFGPEEIVFTLRENSTYEFIVDDFGKTGKLNKSGAKVEFFVDKELIKVFKVDNAVNYGKIWNVCVLKFVKFDENNFTLQFEG